MKILNTTFSDFQFKVNFEAHYPFIVSESMNLSLTHIRKLINNNIDCFITLTVVAPGYRGVKRSSMKTAESSD